MRKSLLLLIILVVAMLPIFSKIFTKISSAEAVGAKRFIDIGGNVFSFTIPEDFSRDMPAESLIEQLDVSDISRFDNPSAGNLMRRWWDIKEPGWLGKNLGSVMMDISIQRVPENTLHKVDDKTFDVRKRFDFIRALNQKLHLRYDDVNEKDRSAEKEYSYFIPGIITLVGKSAQPEFFDEIYGDQKWTRFGALGPKVEGSVITHFSLPISVDLYLEVTFYRYANTNMSAWGFSALAWAKIVSIIESFHMQYAEGNEFRDIVESKWMNETVQEAIDKDKDRIVFALFGPNIYEEMDSVVLKHEDSLGLESELSAEKQQIDNPPLK